MVGVRVMVGVSVGVGVAVGVGVIVGVGVTVNVAVSVGVFVSVGVGVRVDVGSEEHQDAVYEKLSNTHVSPLPLLQVVSKTCICNPGRNVVTCPRSLGGGSK